MNSSNKEKFNQNEYIKNYNKSTYKNLAVRLRPDDFNLIDDYCKNVGVSKAEFVVKSCQYFIDNNIDLKADVKNSSSDK